MLRDIKIPGFFPDRHISELLFINIYSPLNIASNSSASKFIIRIFAFLMTNQVLPDTHSSASKSEQVEQMFDNISPSYDLLNRIMTFGIDKGWRKKAVKMLRPLQPKIILDVATGTADFAIAALELNPDKIIGIDISNKMLEIGRSKINALKESARIELQTASSEALPFADNYFDAITIGYGVRNFENLEKGLQEIYRVLKPAGALVILETSQPESSWQKFFVNLYTNKIVPLIGRLISNNGIAYKYLINSAQHFPYGEAFVQILKKQNFKTTTCTPLFFGVSSIYFATK